jgi:MtN3 and saliva related transmembrane protein
MAWSLAEWVGTCAACLTTVSFVPQVLQTLRTRDLSGISLGMYASFCAGVALWLLYGVLTLAWPIIIANVLTLGLASTVLTLKVRQVLAARRMDN